MKCISNGRSIAQGNFNNGAQIANKKLQVDQTRRDNEGAQRVTHSAGVSRKTAGSTRVCMNVLPMLAGNRSIPHNPFNQSENECVWVVVHSSGDDQDELFSMPELEPKLDKYK